MKRYAWWLAVIFVVWWAITAPAAAGQGVHHLASFATKAATSMTTLISSI